MKSRHVNTLAATVLAIGAAGVAPAQNHERPETLDQFIAQSDLVFHGEVTRIEYALSTPTGPEGSRIPHTFVTFRVHDVMRGLVADEEITLRFMGGLNRESERFMTISTGSLFDVGDEEVLFVRDNGRALTPIVGNQAGRLRIINGQVYSDDGRSVMLDQGGLLLKGDRYAFEDVMTTNVAGREFSIQVDPSALAVEGQTDSMTREELVERLSLSALTAPPAQGLFASADPRLPFDAPDFTPQRFNVGPHDLVQPDFDPELGEEKNDGSEIIRQRKRD